MDSDRAGRTIRSNGDGWAGPRDGILGVSVSIGKSPRHSQIPDCGTCLSPVITMRKLSSGQTRGFLITLRT